MNQAEQFAIRERFRRALLSALRDVDAASGFPTLGNICRELEAGARGEEESELWHLATGLCVGLAETTVERAPQTLLLFRDMDRLLGQSAPQFEALDDLASRLRERLPGAAQDPTASSAPNVSATMETLSSHPAWQDETAEAAREELASLVGGGDAATGDEGRDDGLTPDMETARSRPETREEERSISLDEGEPTPLSNIVPRLERVLRLGCQTLDRHCMFDLEGTPRIGQTLLKRLIEPLEIVLRNALFFGVAPERPSTATMTLRSAEDEDSRRLELETDGVSPDLARIAMEALHEGTPPGLTSGIELLLDESRSTADHATRLRGYGAGLFEAREILESVGARLSMELPRDAGLRFIIILPRRE